MLKYKRFLWALRKIQLPIANDAIVLDVGSGGNPHPRADILLDRLTGSEHRGGDPMLIDRTAVIGDAMRLPFKDKSFDFVIASHILEHMSNPEVFLYELQRIGKAGYIETPNFICEKFIPCRAHCLEIALVGNALQIYKKTSWSNNSICEKLNFLKENEEWGSLYIANPEMFHVRYLWKDKIEFNIINPEVSSDWLDDIYKNSTATEEIIEKTNNRSGWRHQGSLFYEFIQNNKRKNRLKNFDIFSILICPKCKGDLQKEEKKLHCANCNCFYQSSPIINFEKN